MVMSMIHINFGLALKIIVVSACLTTQVLAKESVLSIPIALDTKLLEQRINEAIPEVVVNQPSKKQKCVGAISCDVSAKVTRTSPISLQVSGNSLTGTVSLHGSATARGRGWIGRNIRETARGSLTLTIKITPSISSDWLISSDAQISHTWTRRPEAKLLNLIPVTFGSEADKELNKLKHNLVPEIDKQLNALNLKKHASTIWSELQIPHLIGTAPNIYLQIQPKTIGLSGLTTDAQRILALVSIKAETDVVLGSPAKLVKTELPNLGRVPQASSGSSISINVPVRASYRSIKAIMADEFELPGEQEIAGLFGQKLTFVYGVPELLMQSHDVVYVKIPSQLIGAGKKPRDFRIELFAKPIVNWDQRTVSVELSSSKIFTGDESEPSFLYSLLFEAVGERIEDKFQISFEPELATIEQHIVNVNAKPIHKNIKIGVDKPSFSFGGFEVDETGVSVIVSMNTNAAIDFIP